MILNGGSAYSLSIDIVTSNINIIVLHDTNNFLKQNQFIRV